jgi:hypothetical protein
MRRASGQQPAGEPSAPASPKARDPKSPPAAKAGDRRAEGSDASSGRKRP